MMNRILATLIVFFLLFNLVQSTRRLVEENYYDDGNGTCYPKFCPECKCLSPTYLLVQEAVEKIIDDIVAFIVRNAKSQRK